MGGWMSVAGVGLSQLPNPLLTPDDAKMMYVCIPTHPPTKTHPLEKEEAFQPTHPPTPPFYRATDIVLDPNTSALTFKDLGINPTPLEKVAFNYLYRYRTDGGHFPYAEGYH